RAQARWGHDATPQPPPHRGAAPPQARPNAREAGGLTRRRGRRGASDPRSCRERSARRAGTKTRPGHGAPPPPPSAGTGEGQLPTRGPTAPRAHQGRQGLGGRG
ncbi:unnamed protein product, partial [Gulo gulo]